MTSAIRLEQRGFSVELTPGNSDIEVGEGIYLASISSPSPPIIDLDDEPVAVSWRAQDGVCAWVVDLTNQVGFHRFHVRFGATSTTYDFRTHTAKATWDEIQAMARVCGEAYLGFRRQFTYVAANGEPRKVRLPQVHFAWLRERIPELVQLATSINERPARQSVTQTAKGTQARGFLPAATSRLLRGNPALLEERADGLVQVGGRAYWPAHVVLAKNHRQDADLEHKQIAAFLRLLIGGCRELTMQLEPDLQVPVVGFARQVASLAQVRAFAQHGLAADKVTISAPTSIQRTDTRYKRMRELHIEYLSDVADTATYEQSIRLNIKDVWEIYQTFIAHVIGNAFGLSYTSPASDLRHRAPSGESMRSTEWSLFFDAKVPVALLPSWRDHTSRPADERPDVVLLSRTGHPHLLLDAKFKQGPHAGRATQRDLFEMQAYMNSFSLANGGIVYPGPKPEAGHLHAEGNCLLELPLRAAHFSMLGSKDAVHDYVRKAVAATFAASATMT